MRRRLILLGPAAALLGVSLVSSGGPASAATENLLGASIPAVRSTDDPRAVTVGMTFTARTSGTVTHLRFYKGRGNTGTHVGSVYSADGSISVQAVFQKESATGWQSAKLAAPVKVTSGTTLVAAVFMPKGRYASTNDDRWPKTTQSLVARNGVYTYGSDPRFPTSGYRSSNYFVDVSFTPDGRAPAVTPSPTPTPSSSATARPSATPAPSPSASAPTSPAPSSSGGRIVLGRTFPDASTTGVPAGTALTPYTGPCTIQTDGFVIDAKVINCDMRILAQDVKITRSVLNGSIYSDPDYMNGSFSMTDSEVRMPASTGTGVAEANFVLTRVEVTGGSRSVNCALNCTVQDSYVHGQYTDERGIDHESGIRMGSGSTLRHNYITCDATPVEPDAGCSSGLTGYGDFAVVQNNVIDDNVLDGGPYGSMSYCMYGGSTQGKPFSRGVNNIKVTNNIFPRGASGRCGIYGPVTSFDSAAPGNVWSNNLWDDGKPVAAAN